MSDKPVFGYIGIGLMGEPMVKRLLDAGHTVHVWNRSREKLDTVLSAGAIEAASPASVAAEAHIICTCLTNTDAVEEVVFGENGIVESGSEGRILIDFSSIKPDATKEFAGRLKAQCGMGWVDAPVSGGVGGAADGTLAIMAGGTAEDVERIRPHMDCLCDHLTHMGPNGAGQITKLCNQMIVVTCLSVVTEVVNLAEKAGIDATKIPEALAGGWADSKPMQIYLPRMAKCQYEPKTGTAGMMIKDATSALEAGASLGVPMPVTEQAAAIVQKTIDGGWGDDDITSMIRVYMDD